MKPMNVLIVEDNTMVAEDCRLSLEGMGYAVTSVVATGEEAVQQAASDSPPDAVLMDIRLRGEMDGIEAAERIYARRQIPVVFLSAYSDDELLRRARKAGSFGYLVKPFEERELFAMLEMAIYKARAERERREMEIRLRQAKKLEAIRAMAGGIAHHLNNRLTVVIGNLELAEEYCQANPDALKCIREAGKSAGKAARMGRLLLTYLGHRRAKYIPMDLSETIREQAKKRRKELPAQVELETDFPSSGPMIHAEPAQMADIAKALIQNAREAIGETAPGRIRVSAGTADASNIGDARRFPADWDEAGKTFAYLSVADTGCGMDEETIDRVFDPFYSEKFLGRGLELAAVFGIVHAAGGCVAVSSEPGRGSEFTVFFPIASD